MQDIGNSDCYAEHEWNLTDEEAEDLTQFRLKVQQDGKAALSKWLDVRPDSHTCNGVAKNDAALHFGMLVHSLEVLTDDDRESKKLL